MKLNIHYRALTELYSKEDRTLYSNFILLKSQTEDYKLKKPGFVSKSELQKVADYIRVSKYTFIKRLNYLHSKGLIQKSKYGYTLTSTKIVLDNHFNFTKSKKKNSEILYHAHAKIKLNDVINDTYVIDLMMLYALLIQIYNRKIGLQNGLNVQSRKRNKKNSLEMNISVALEYLKKAGKYQSKTTISKMIDDLQSVRLLNVKKGELNNVTDWYEQNQYQINHISKLNLSNLHQNKKKNNDDIIREMIAYANGNGNANSNITRTRKRTRKCKSKRKLKPHELAKIVETTAIEKRFIQLVYDCRSILVVNGILGYAFLNRKINRSMISNLLNKMMTNEATKSFLLSKFNESDFNVEKEYKTLYDPTAFVYDRQFTYTVDKITLNDNGNGNYNSNMNIMTHHESMLKAKQRRAMMSSEYHVACTI